MFLVSFPHQMNGGVGGCSLVVSYHGDGTTHTNTCSYMTALCSIECAHILHSYHSYSILQVT